MNIKKVCFRLGGLACAIRELEFKLTEFQKNLPVGLIQDFQKTISGIDSLIDECDPDWILEDNE